jgi:hypothetical protein
VGVDTPFQTPTYRHTLALSDPHLRKSIQIVLYAL